MSNPTMPALLKTLAADAAVRLPLFQERYAEKGGRHIAIGRSVESKAFVFVDFSGGSHRRTIGHGVGWAPSFADYIAWQEHRGNDPIQPYDGSLRRLLRLEMPKDFQYDEVHRSTASLYLPMQILDMDKQSSDDLRALILLELTSYALPYLVLMLSKRHGIELSVTELAGTSYP